MRATGAAGAIDVNDGVITLTRAGFLGAAAETRTVLLAHVRSVEWRAASAIEPGFLRVLTDGEAPGKFLSQDRTAVGFRKDQEEEFIVVYESLHQQVYGRAPDGGALRKPTSAWMLIAGVVACLCIIVFYAFVVF